MHDVKFPGALEYLRTVRCYVKFERERVELEKQVNKHMHIPNSTPHYHYDFIMPLYN